MPSSTCCESGMDVRRMRMRMQMNPRPHTHRGSTGFVSSALLLATALGTGYVLGSMPPAKQNLSMIQTIQSFWDAATNSLDVLEECIHTRGVPLYAILSLAYYAYYLYERWYRHRDRGCGGTASTEPTDQLESKSKSKSKSSTAARQQRWFRGTSSSLLSSFSFPPSLRMMSTATIPEEDDEELKEEDAAAVDSDATSSDGEEPPRALTAPVSSSSPTPATENDDDDDDHRPPPIDMNGTFKVVQNHNFGEFLKAQGVPWFLCNAASKARPTHTFVLPTHSNLTIQIKGIIESETSYKIDGPHTETQIRGRVFRDTVRYLYDDHTDNDKNGNNDNDGGATQTPRRCVGLQTTKFSVNEGYTVHVTRRLVPAGTTFVPPVGHHGYDLHVPANKDRLWMGNRMVRADGGDSAVLASQLFHRVE